MEGRSLFHYFSNDEKTYIFNNIFASTDNYKNFILLKFIWETIFGLKKEGVFNI